MQKSIDNLVKAIEDGVYTRSTKQRLEELENKENEIQLSIQNEKLNNPVLTEDQIRFTLNKFVNLDLKVQKIAK